MDLECLDHIHFVVPDLARAKRVHGAFLNGTFVPDYGGPDQNAYGAWHSSGGDFIEPIDREKGVFGGPPMPRFGMLSPSFRVRDVDAGIAQAEAHGLLVRSRIGSEDIGLGKNVIQAQLAPEPVSGFPFEIVEHQLPGDYTPLTESAVDHVEFGVRDLEAAARALEPILGSAFGAERVDAARGLRTRRLEALGLLLSSPLESATESQRATWLPGLSTVAYGCSDLRAGAKAAQDEGLVPIREIDTENRHEMDFEPWAGVSLRLVERSS